MEQLAKAATVGALAMNGGAGAGTGGASGDVIGGGSLPKLESLQLEQAPACHVADLPIYHHEDNCQLRSIKSFVEHHAERGIMFDALVAGGTGATLVPNQQTVYCPLNVQSLDNPSAVRGFDTTWIVENTATTPVVVSWVVNGQEYSPFHPDVTPAQDDPEAILQPNEWKAVPAYESYVYHVRALDKDYQSGQVLLQHRVGLIPLGNPNSVACDASQPDVEPISPQTAETVEPFRRTPTHPVRQCNTMDVGFRNQVGCPLNVYWAGTTSEKDVPTTGFVCGEQFRFHLGTKPATQDFMHDWESATKFEGTFIGHTFVARLTSDPSVVVDSYTLRPTPVIDCPTRHPQMVATGGQLKVGVPQENVLPVDEHDEALTAAAALAAGVAGMDGHVARDQPLPDIGAGISGGEL
jgi:hypothetical protein